jgi:hypothetical protein
MHVEERAFDGAVRLSQAHAHVVVEQPVETHVLEAELIPARLQLFAPVLLERRRVMAAAYAFRPVLRHSSDWLAGANGDPHAIPRFRDRKKCSPRATTGASL